MDVAYPLSVRALQHRGGQAPEPQRQVEPIGGQAQPLRRTPARQLRQHGAHTHCRGSADESAAEQPAVPRRRQHPSGGGARGRELESAAGGGGGECGDGGGQVGRRRQLDPRYGAEGDVEVAQHDGKQVQKRGDAAGEQRRFDGGFERGVAHPLQCVLQLGTGLASPEGGVVGRVVQQLPVDELVNQRLDGAHRIHQLVEMLRHRGAARENVCVQSAGACYAIAGSGWPALGIRSEQE